MIVAEVIARNYYSRRNGVAQEMPIGSTVVVRAIPADLTGKLRKVRDAKDSEFLVNDTPEAAKLRDEGKERQADQVMAKAKEQLTKKLDAELAKQKAAEAKETAAEIMENMVQVEPATKEEKTTLPKPSAKP